MLNFIAREDSCYDLNQARVFKYIIKSNAFGGITVVIQHKMKLNSYYN